MVKLKKKSKLEYFYKYDPNKQAKPFWVNCKPYFQTSTVKLIQTSCLVKNQEIANTFNDYFGSVVCKSLF